jgi:hypothetical protein
MLSPMSKFSRFLNFLTGKSSRDQHRLLPEAEFVVHFDDDEVVCSRPNGVIERVAWADLEAVIIETNDTGPWGADLWWLLLGARQTGCLFPNGATGETEVAERLRQLPDFDFEAFFQAMQSTENQRFLCWRKSRAELP